MLYHVHIWYNNGYDIIYDIIYDFIIIIHDIRYGIRYDIKYDIIYDYYDIVQMVRYHDYECHPKRSVISRENVVKPS